MKKTLTTIAASALCAALISSCSKTEDKKSYANVLIAQTAPNVKKAIMIGTDEKIPYAGTLEYGMNTGYISIESGNRNISLKYNDSVTVTTAITLGTGMNYSLFMIQDSGGRKASTLVLSDNMSTSGSNARLRFVNLSPNSVPVNVFITKTADTIFKTKAYKDYTEFTDFKPGVYNMHISRIVTGDTVCYVPTFSMSAGKIYTLYLKGIDSTGGTTGIGTGLIQHN